MGRAGNQYTRRFHVRKGDETIAYENELIDAQRIARAEQGCIIDWASSKVIEDHTRSSLDDIFRKYGGA